MVSGAVDAHGGCHEYPQAESDPELGPGISKDETNEATEDGLQFKKGNFQDDTLRIGYDLLDLLPLQLLLLE